MRQRRRVREARTGRDVPRVVRPHPVSAQVGSTPRPPRTTTSRTRPASTTSGCTDGSTGSLGPDIAAHTLLVRGSATAFREHGAALHRLAEEAPYELRRYPDAGHRCLESGRGPWRLSPTPQHVSGVLHIGYRDDRPD